MYALHDQLTGLWDVGHKNSSGIAYPSTLVEGVTSPDTVMMGSGTLGLVLLTQHP